MSRENLSSFLGISIIRNNNWITAKCENCEQITGTKEVTLPTSQTNTNTNANTNTGEENTCIESTKTLCGYCMRAK